MRKQKAALVIIMFIAAASLLTACANQDAIKQRLINAIQDQLSEMATETIDETTPQTQAQTETNEKTSDDSALAPEIQEIQQPSQTHMPAKSQIILPERNYDKWKEIYSKWLKDNENPDGTSKLWDVYDNSSFTFIDWEGYDAPILCIERGNAYSDHRYYKIINGKVEALGRGGNAALGAINFEMVNNTPFYFSDHSGYYGGYIMKLNDKFYDSIFYNYDIYSVENGGIQLNIFWMEPGSEFGPVDDSDSYDEYEIRADGMYGDDCYINGEKVPIETALLKIDELLGAGAKAQIFGESADINGDGMPDGPLSYAQESKKLKAALVETAEDGSVGYWWYYHWSRWQEALNAL